MQVWNTEESFSEFLPQLIKDKVFTVMKMVLLSAGFNIDNQRSQLFETIDTAYLNKYSFVCVGLPPLAFPLSKT